MQQYEVGEVGWSRLPQNLKTIILVGFLTLEVEQRRAHADGMAPAFLRASDPTSRHSWTALDGSDPLSFADQQLWRWKDSIRTNSAWVWSQGLLQQTSTERNMKILHFYYCFSSEMLNFCNLLERLGYFPEVNKDSICIRIKQNKTNPSWWCLIETEVSASLYSELYVFHQGPMVCLNILLAVSGQNTFRLIWRNVARDKDFIKAWYLLLASSRFCHCHTMESSNQTWQLSLPSENIRTKIHTSFLHLYIIHIKLCVHIWTSLNLNTYHMFGLPIFYSFPHDHEE